MESKELAKKIATILDDKKAQNVKVMEIKDITSLADYFVICNGTSSTHLKALCDEVDFVLKDSDIRVRHNEGYTSANWILMDYGDVVVHIFNQESLDFYDLARLWSEANEIDFKEEA